MFFDTYTKAGRAQNNSTTLKAATGFFYFVINSRWKKRSRAGRKRVASGVGATVCISVSLHGLDICGGDLERYKFADYHVRELLISPVSYSESMLSVITWTIRGALDRPVHTSTQVKSTVIARPVFLRVLRVPASKTRVPEFPSSVVKISSMATPQWRGTSIASYTPPDGSDSFHVQQVHQNGTANIFASCSK